MNHVKIANFFNILPKCWNFATSGHTEADAIVNVCNVCTGTGIGDGDGVEVKPDDLEFAFYRVIFLRFCLAFEWRTSGPVGHKELLF